MRVYRHRLLSDEPSQLDCVSKMKTRTIVAAALGVALAAVIIFAVTLHVPLSVPSHRAETAARGVAQRLLGDDIVSAYVP